MPTVSPTPPSSAPQFTGRAVVAGGKGRVIGLFGPPGSGVTTILECLRAGFQHVGIVEPDDSLEENVRNLRADVTFIDGYPHTGFNDRNEPMGPRTAQYLYDRRLVFPGSGAIIQITADPELLIHAGRATEEGVSAWYRGLPALESHVRMLGLPYFMVHNEPGEDGLMQAIRDIAVRSGLL